MSDYATDILTWSERQSALLRRVGAGEKVNDQVDWDNVAEEIESVGSEQLHVVASAVGASASAHAQGRGMAAVRRSSSLASRG